MKKSIFLLAFLASSSAIAQPIESAEQLSKSHSRMYVYEVATRLGVTIYDGPYDGEIYSMPCAVVPSRDCVDFNSFDLNVTTLSDSSNQSVEDFLYYAAHRNVMAGYYDTNHTRAYASWIKEFGEGNAINVEIQILKSGSKPVTLFTDSGAFSHILSEVDEAY